MLLASFSLLLAVQATRVEIWPSGSKKAEYEIAHDLRGVEVRQGKFRSWFEDGTLESEGAFAGGRETGPWLRFHASGTKAAAGSYADGLESGPWETFYPDGKPESKGAYVRGVRDGRWTFWNGDGTKDNVASGLYELEVYRSKEDGRHYRGYRVDNLRQGPWTSFWPDRTKQLEGRFQQGKREGPWVFTHPDGAVSTLLLSGVYGAGTWSGPIPAPDVPPFDPARFPAIEPSPRGLPPGHAELEAIVRSALALHSLSEEARAILLRAGVPAIPLVLEVWRTLDPESADGRRALGFVEEQILRPLCSGHALSRSGSAGPSDAASARELLRAWLSLWALTRTDLVFWETDVPGPTPAGVGLRDRLQDPPLLERDVRYAPEAQAPPKASGPAPTPGAAYASRFGKEKEERLRRAPAGTKDSIARALAWLAAHQASDGHWSNAGFREQCGKIGKEGCTGPGAEAHDVGATGLALLALLGDGRLLVEGAPREGVVHGLEWLVGQQDAAGLIGSQATPQFLYDHSIATAALCEGLGLGEESLRAPAEKAVALLQLARHPRGAWRYDVPATEEGDTSVTGWAVSALMAARRAGLAVEAAALDGALLFLARVTDPISGRVGYTGPDELSSRLPESIEFPADMGEALTSIGLLCRIWLGERPSTSPILLEHARLIAAKPPVLTERWGADHYYWFYATYALHELGDPFWDAWENDLAKVVIRSQVRRGDAEGSWDPLGPWGKPMGRVCTTALLALTLECSYRFRRTLER